MVVVVVVVVVVIVVLVVVVVVVVIVTVVLVEMPAIEVSEHTDCTILAVRNIFVWSKSL